MTILGDRIRERLIAKGHDPSDGGQTWLAKRIGMTQQGVEAILGGRSKRPRLLKEISEALATSEAYLLGETDDPSPPDAPPEKIPPAVIEAFEKIPGAPLTDREVQLIVGQLDLIALSRRPQNGGNQNSEPQPIG